LARTWRTIAQERRRSSGAIISGPAQGLSVTIGNSHATGHGSYAHCLDCQNATKFDVPAPIVRYGADRPPKVMPLKCSRCGCRRFSVTAYPLVPPRG
jgi:hypothetical protein